MQATENGKKSVQSSEETLCGPESKARKLASKGFRTTQDVKNLGLALAEDILGGEVSHKIASPVVRSVTLTIRTAEFEHTRGNGTSVYLGESERNEQDDELDRKEAELLEQLAHLRKERNAG